MRSVSTLLDRQQCLADLDQWVFTTAGGGCIALVHGEAGIGKTALVREFTQRHPTRRVLWGACDDLFTPRSLAPLHDIARQAKGTLLDAIDEGATRDVIFSTVLDDLERGTPATVVFEDMQWADPGTLDLLKFLGRRITRTRAILVLTYRDEETGPRHPLRSVIGDLPRDQLRRLALTPLCEQSVAKLARQAGRTPANLHALTGGNPLLVTEALASGSADVPLSIRDAVLARAIRLPASAREIAEMVCVFPGKTPTQLLESAVAVDESVIESCRIIGVARDENGSFSFRHELVRRALESTLSETQKHRLHTRLLTILKADPTAPAARLAYHAEGCGNVGAVLHYAPIAAAHAASIGSHREAAAHYRMALRHVCPLEPGRRSVLQEQLARAERAADRIAATYFNSLSQAITQRQYDLASRYQEEGVNFCAGQELLGWKLELIACGARSKFDRGDWAGCSDDVSVVLRSPNVPPAARVRALTLLAHIRTRRGDPDVTTPLEEAQALADSMQDAQGLSALAPIKAEAAFLRAGALANICELAGDWRAAADAWRELECPYEHATVLALHGGEAEKREALAIFEGLEAAPASRVIGKQFRLEGIKRIPRGARPTTQSNPFGLTRREAQVLELLSTGMRNSAIARALFVSQKTVDHHVSAILGKLGVPSRGAAVVAARVTEPQSCGKIASPHANAR